MATMTDTGAVTTEKVTNGEFTDISEYTYQYIKFYSSAPGRFDRYSQEAARMAGVPYTGEIIPITDKLTGAVMESLVMDAVTDDNNDGHWRTTQAEAMVNNLTSIRLPSVYLSAEESQRVADLSTVINDYVTSETAKFIVGARPLDELDAYFAELKDLGIEEYIDIYTNAWAGYIATIQ